MAATYEVWLLNPTGDTLDVIDEWMSLTYARAVNDIGTCQLVLSGDYSPFANLKPDGRLVVWRNSGGLNYIDTESVYLITEIERTLARDGTRLITVTGLSAVELLKRRIVAYDSGTAATEKIGAADDLMKDVVDENLNDAATDSNRDLSTYLSIEGKVALGPSVNKAIARDNVLDVCKDLSQAAIQAGSAVYFDIVAPTHNTLEFRTFRGLRGSDHSFPGGVNPVVLAPERGNLVNVARSYDWSNEVTFAYAGGQGVEDERSVFSASSDDRINRTPFSRREVFVNGSLSSGSSASEMLQDEAKTAVRAGRPKRSFSGTLVNVPGATEYGVHWKFGDKVTAEFEGEAVDCVIDSVQVGIARGKETINAKLRAVEDE
jgi:hypothetical protein